MIIFFATLAGALTGVQSAIAECQQWQSYLEALPEDKREAAIQRRRERLAAEKAESDRLEYLEAIKPHTLWSFLGLGSK